jgi:xanthine dehydrogenase accessory factor
MMLFTPDGRSVGTVGGGRVEFDTAAIASRCLAEGSSIGIEVAMVGADATGSDPICGGKVALAVEYVADPAAYSAAAAALARGSTVTFVYELVPPGASKKGGLLAAVLDRKGSPVWGKGADIDHERALEAAASESGFVSEEGKRAYVCVRPADRLLILGGGHVGLALARFAADLGFRVTVGDERQEFAAPGRFPTKVDAVHGKFLNIIEEFEFDDSTYVVIATPNHLFDLECVRAVMGRGYRYAGFIGSRRKTRMVLDTLTEEGFDRSEVESLKAPIGIDIGAETPAEIAVSILAEIIAARRDSPSLKTIDADRIRRRS